MSVSAADVVMLVVAAFVLVRRHSFSLGIGGTFGSPRGTSTIVSSVSGRMDQCLVVRAVVSLSANVVV